MMRSQPKFVELMLYVALLSGPPRLRERDPLASLSGAVDWSVMLNMVVWGLGALWILHQFNESMIVQKKLPHVGRVQQIGLLFSAALALSILVSPARLLTAYRTTQVAIGILFCYFWVQRYGVETTLKHLFYGLGLVSTAIAMAAVFAPGLVYAGERLRGDYIANAGAVGALGVVVLLSYPTLIRQKWLYTAFVGLFVTLVALSRTRSAYGVVLVFLFISAFRMPLSRPLRLMLSVVLVALIAVVLFGELDQVTAWFVRDEDSVSTLSDRVPLWETAISATLERSPIIGLGFYANREILRSYNPGLGSTHSAFVEVLSGGGILSFGIFSLLYLMVGYSGIRLFFQRGREQVVFCTINLLVAVTLTGLVSEEMVIASPTSFAFWTLLALIPALSTRKEEAFQAGEHPPHPQPLPAARR